LDEICALQHLKRDEEREVTKREPPKLSKGDWGSMLEAIEEHLHSACRTTMIPLAYVVRISQAEPPESNDPSTNYDTIEDEMIARAPIVEIMRGMEVLQFMMDKKAVWDTVADICQNTKE